MSTATAWSRRPAIRSIGGWRGSGMIRSTVAGSTLRALPLAAASARRLGPAAASALCRSSGGPAATRRLGPRFANAVRTRRNLCRGTAIHVLLGWPWCVGTTIAGRQGQSLYGNQYGGQPYDKSGATRLWSCTAKSNARGVCVRPQMCRFHDGTHQVNGSTATAFNSTILAL